MSELTEKDTLDAINSFKNEIERLLKMLASKKNYGYSKEVILKSICHNQQSMRIFQDALGGFKKEQRKRKILKYIA